MRTSWTGGSTFTVCYNARGEMAGVVAGEARPGVDVFLGVLQAAGIVGGAAIIAPSIEKAGENVNLEANVKGLP